MPQPKPYISPPSDDDPPPQNIFAPIVMVPTGAGFDAMMGPIMLGQVRLHNGPRGYRAVYQCSLPDVPTTAKPAASIEIGLRLLSATIRDWFAACGHPLPKTIIHGG